MPARASTIASDTFAAQIPTARPPIVAALADLIASSRADGSLAALEKVRHAGDVAVECVFVEQQRRRGYVGKRDRRVEDDRRQRSIGEEPVR